MAAVMLAALPGAATGRAAARESYQTAPLVDALRSGSQAVPPRGAAAARATTARPKLQAPRPLPPQVNRARAAAVQGPPSAAQLGALAQRDPGAAAPRAAGSPGGAKRLAARNPARAAAAPAGIPFPNPPIIDGAIEGIDQSNCDCTPADATLAVGPANVVQAVNTSLQILDKAGDPLSDWIPLWDWFAPVYSNDFAVFSAPRALYDQFSRRFVLVALATDFDAGESVVLVSVSPLNTALGTWRLFVIDASLNGTVLTNNFINGPGLGVDTRALYISGNMFDFDSLLFRYAKVIILDKARLYGGTLKGASVWDLIDASGERAFGIQPAHALTSASVGFMVNTRYPGPDVVAGMTIWAVSNPTTRPRLAARFVRTGAYATPSFGAQPFDVDDTLLDMGDGRLYNAVYRSGFIYTAHATGIDWGDGLVVSAVQYFQLSPNRSRPVRELYYGGPDFWYGWPAIMADGRNNLGIVFNRSGFDEYASLLFTGRRPGDPGSLLRGSVPVVDGFGQLLTGDAGVAFLGNYNGIALDPAAVNTFWMTGMFAVDIDFWSTAIATGGF
jgi:hypothetical protein